MDSFNGVLLCVSIWPTFADTAEFNGYIYVGLVLPLVMTGCGGSELICYPHDVLIHIGGEADITLSLRFAPTFVFCLECKCNNLFSMKWFQSIS